MCYSFHHFHSRQQQHFFSQAKATWLVAKILAGYTRLGPAETVGSELKCHGISAAKRKITRVLMNPPLTTMSAVLRSLAVVSSITPDQIVKDKDENPSLSPMDEKNDALDKFNHPRFHRQLILQALHSSDHHAIGFHVPPVAASTLKSYLSIHSSGLIDFLESAWHTWDALGEEGQDPSATSPSKATTPALIPFNVPLGRDQNQ
jgi:hypothetical protein